MTDINRLVFRISGADAHGFLQNLVTNDVASGPIVYSALLTPQGKYLADFFLISDDDGFLLDAAESHAAGLIQRLNMYRLRADVDIAETKIAVSVGQGMHPKNALPDPRLPDAIWRTYGEKVDIDPAWAELRVEHIIPETGVELTSDTYILEAGFERLNGVDFKKGCYVGQEVTARMKHKTELRKGLTRLNIQGRADVGAAIMANGKAVGQVFTQAQGRALAHVRYDRVEDGMTAGDAFLSPDAG